jgi:hypothetical protein
MQTCTTQYKSAVIFCPQDNVFLYVLFVIVFDANIFIAFQGYYEDLNTAFEIADGFDAEI